MMGAVRGYFSNQFKKHKLFLEHDDASDFYMSCWQKNRTVLPLLCVRLVLFLLCVAMLLASIIMAAHGGTLEFWPIYLTNWGLLFITFTTGTALAVSWVAYFKGPIDALSGLPWYVKAYWVLYNISVTLAFFITIYYYSLLFALVAESIDNKTLDFFNHGVNSIIMFTLLMTSRHPWNVLHFYHVLLVYTVYNIFNGIYNAAGGTDPDGNNFIYPTVDWSTPGITFGLVVAIAVLLVALYFITVALAGLRDLISGRCRGDKHSAVISS